MVFLVAFSSKATSDVQHLGLQINSQGIKSILSSAIKSISNEKEMIFFELPQGRMDEKFKIDSSKMERSVRLFNGLLGVDFAEGMDVYLKYSKVDIGWNIDVDSIDLALNQPSKKNAVKVKFRTNLSKLNVDIPSLDICSREKCVDGSYIKFKNISIDLQRNSIPLELELLAECSLIKSEAKCVLVSIASNLNSMSPPSIDLTYLNGFSNGEQWPQISSVQVGPLSFGMSYTRDDLIKDIALLNSDLKREIVKRAGIYLSNSLATKINSQMKKAKPSKLSWSFTFSGEQLKLFGDRPKEELRSKRYRQAIDKLEVVAPVVVDQPMYPTLLDLLIRNLNYKVEASKVSNDADNQLLSLVFDSSLFVNGKKMLPSEMMGYNNCSFGFNFQNCARPITDIKYDLDELSQDSKVAIAISEPYLNAVLESARSSNVLQTIFDIVADMPGIYISNSGVRIHFLNGLAYLVVNLKVVLAEQDGWIDRVLGDMIESRFGETDGEIFFPIEIPISLHLENDSDETFLVANAGSPFDVNGELINFHGYPSNLNGAAETWFVNIKKTILKKIYKSFKDSVGFECSDPGCSLKEQRIPISEYLKKLPVGFIPTNVRFENSGHMVIYGEISNLKL